MAMDTKTAATKPAAVPPMNAPQALGDMAEKGATQAKEAYDKMSTTAHQAADLIKSSYSTTIEGVQDYNNKLIEFAHANTDATFDFVQKLASVKSPSDLIQLSTEHARKQLETLTEQTKQLAALAQQGVAKAFNQAA